MNGKHPMDNSFFFFKLEKLKMQFNEKCCINTGLFPKRKMDIFFITCMNFQ